MEGYELRCIINGINVAQSYKGKGVMESCDCPRPERKWYKETKEEGEER